MGARPLRVLQRNWWVYRRAWRGSVFVSFLEPILFLGAIGFGLGGLISSGASGGSFGGVTYAMFLAPGLLAAGAMQTAVFEASYPIAAKIRWRRTYSAMLSTPLGVADLLLGDLAWIAVRCTMVATAFLAVMAGFGLVASPLGILAVPAAVLTGLAFATPLMAFAPLQKTGNGYTYVFRFGIMPLFLFSGTFFPVDRLPDLVQPLALLSPLYHGVELVRGLTLGTIEPLVAAGHVAFLAAFAVVGAAIALPLLVRRLTP